MRLHIWRSSLPAGEAGRSQPIPEAFDTGKRIVCEGCLDGGCDCPPMPIFAVDVDSVEALAALVEREGGCELRPPDADHDLVQVVL